jgi:large conductance mechanosensitive channel
LQLAAGRLSWSGSGNLSKEKFMSNPRKGLIGFIKTGWGEFRDFAFKGNMIDLAIAVVIGAAFGKVIDAVVKEIIQPVINCIFWIPTHLSLMHDPEILKGLGEKLAMHMSNLVSALINFVIIAFAVFITMVKISSALMKKMTAPPTTGPITKECPQCLSNIPIKARKCAFCTSELTPAA